MSREIEFKFVVERDGVKYLTQSYALEEDGLPSHDEILEDLEGSCTCGLNESNNCCDGSCMEWEGAVVVGKLQSVGLKDKNGKMIFEGDQYYEGRNNDGRKLWTVKWAVAGFMGDYANGSGQRYINYEDIEVIGNIHQNPELLKGE